MFTRLKEDFQHHRKEESGAIMIIIGAFVAVLLSITALTVDYGVIYFKAAEYQKDLDDAARAASISMMQYLNKNPGVDMTDPQTNATVNQLCRQEVDRMMKMNGYSKTNPKTVWWSKVDFKLLNIEGNTTKRYPVVDVDGNIDCELTFGKAIRNDDIRFTTGGTAETTYVETEGKEELTVDVVFVLDISGSMYYNRNTPTADRNLYKDKLHKMVLNVNKSIKSIKEENADNRIGVVVYSGSDKTKPILNLTKNVNTNVKNDGNTVSNSWRLGANSGTTNYLNYKLDNDIKKFTISGQDDYVYSPDSGGTFIQLGIYKGCQMLYNAQRVDNKNRTPALFVMTDGEATFGISDYVNCQEHITKTYTNYPVMIYKDINYGGNARGLNVGTYNSTALGNIGMNKQVSSMKVGKGYKVVLWSDQNRGVVFDGTNGQFNHSDFTQIGYNNYGATWNDRASKIEVTKTANNAENVCTTKTNVIGWGGAGTSEDDKIELGRLGANTIWTACYWKPLIKQHYNQYLNSSDKEYEAMFYSMGFKLDSITYKDFAEFILFPDTENWYEKYISADASGPLKHMIEYLYYGDDWYNPFNIYYDATKEDISKCLQQFANDVVNPEKIYTTRLTR